MFSGIVKEIGTIVNLENKKGILEASVSSITIIKDLKVSESVAVNGFCLTVSRIQDQIFIVQIVEETFNKTNFKQLKIGAKVNLEPSLRLNEKLDGHLVLGHVDGIGKIQNITALDENKVLQVDFQQQDIRKHIAQKGSITVNGVSLTVVNVDIDWFSFVLIPYTRDNTNLGLIKTNDLVNLEIDVISRYLVNYLESTKELARK